MPSIEDANEPANFVWTSFSCSICLWLSVRLKICVFYETILFYKCVHNKSRFTSVCARTRMHTRVHCCVHTHTIYSVWILLLIPACISKERNKWTPNKLTPALALQTFIPEMHSSNLGRGSGSPGRPFIVFISFFTVNPGWYLEIYKNLFLSHHILFNLTFFNHFIVRPKVDSPLSTKDHITKFRI
jgi:hypothetical protein